MKRLAFAASLFSLCLLPFPALAVPIEFVSTVVEPNTRDVHFVVQFASAPDFFTVDEYGRQKDEFQFYAYDGPEVVNPNPSNFTSITRGGEIHFGNGLPIRDTFPVGEPDPGSGGWGAIRDTVPFVLDGQVLSFTTDLSTLGDTNGDRRFGYTAQAISFGGTPEPPPGLSNGYYLPSVITDCVSGTVCQNTLVRVPAPDMLWPTVIGMVGLAGLVAWRPRREAASAP